MPRTLYASERQQCLGIVGPQLESRVQRDLSQRITCFVAVILRLANKLIGQVDVIQRDLGVLLDALLIEPNGPIDGRGRRFTFAGLLRIRWRWSVLRRSRGILTEGIRRADCTGEAQTEQKPRCRMK